jgi:hypothetical protein
MPGFGFVMNIESLAEATFNLGPGIVLRRATNQEIAVIKGNLQAFNVESLPAISGLTWQKRLSLPAGPIEILPDAEWRYFVIAFEGTNQALIDLELASCVASFEMEVGFTFMTDHLANPAGVGWHPDRLFHTVAALRSNDALFCSVTSDDIQEIVSINTQLQSCASKTKALVSQLQGLKGLPHQSQLRFLGYFALLESILTHQPKPDDRYDTITRQVKKKLALLDKRWARKINYSPFPGVSGSERVWALMYSYRSAIAHGGNPDFARELKALKTAGHALVLLKDTVKAVLRHALIEPELLNDLRDC